MYTLESGIVVPVRLLIFEKFSHQYTLILVSTFIHFSDLLNWFEKNQDLNLKFFHFLFDLLVTN